MTKKKSVHHSTKNNKNKPEWISTTEAAEILGVSDVWVLKLIAQNELKAFRLSGRAWAIERSSVEKNLENYLGQTTRGKGRPRQA